MERFASRYALVLP